MFVVPTFETPPPAEASQSDVEPDAAASGGDDGERALLGRLLGDARGRAAVAEALERGELIPFAQGAPRWALASGHYPGFVCAVLTVCRCRVRRVMFSVMT